MASQAFGAYSSGNAKTSPIHGSLMSSQPKMAGLFLNLSATLSQKCVPNLVKYSSLSSQNRCTAFDIAYVLQLDAHPIDVLCTIQEHVSASTLPKTSAYLSSSYPWGCSQIVLQVSRSYKDLELIIQIGPCTHRKRRKWIRSVVIFPKCIGRVIGIAVECGYSVPSAKQRRPGYP